jgi:peptidoglycan/LPS O-acetylase OafA/YrhL
MHIPSLDGIRALSFMIVFLSHAGLQGKVPGYFGLSVFFFLSGYLITTLLRLELDRSGTISLRQFYLRRVLRIFPPFYLVLGLAYLCTALGFWEGSLGPRGITSQLLHFTNYYIIDNGWWNELAPGTWVYWSLAVEEHFYLVFPLLYLALRRAGLSGKQQALALLAICGLVLAWRMVLIFGLNAPKDRTYVATDTRVDSILAGCILAVWNNPVLDREGVSDRALKLVWLPIGCLMVAVSLVFRRFEFEQTLRYTLQSFGLLPFFIAAVRWHDVGPFKLLNTRIAKLGGLLSYSMYLTHTSVIWAFEQRTKWPEPLRAAAALAVVTLLAWLIYLTVERPIGRLRKRLQA